MYCCSSSICKSNYRLQTAVLVFCRKLLFIQSRRLNRNDCSIIYNIGDKQQIGSFVGIKLWIIENPTRRFRQGSSTSTGTVDRQPMIEDAMMSVRCPSCEEPAEGWMMRSNHLDGEGLTEHYSCPCGCRFRVEVVPE